MDMSLILWIVPIALLVVTLLLLLYLLFLNYAPVRKESVPSAAPRQTRSSVTSVDNPVVLAPSPPPAPPQYASQPPPYASQPPQYAPPPYPSAPPQYAPPPYAPPPMAMPPASTELETMGKMIIIGGLEPREVPLPSAQFTVGRFYSPENNVLVALDEKSVSRKHAVMRIAAQGREFYIQDVGSTYGTHIIAEGRFDRLQPGMEARVYNQDVVQFGSAVRVQLVLPCETRSAITQL